MCVCVSVYFCVSEIYLKSNKYPLLYIDIIISSHSHVISTINLSIWIKLKLLEVHVNEVFYVVNVKGRLVLRNLLLDGVAKFVEQAHHVGDFTLPVERL